MFDATTVLSYRAALKCPQISVKPDLITEEQDVENILLKER